MSQKNNSLEIFIAKNLKDIDKYSRPTRGSGCGNELGDVANEYFYIECKQNLTKENLILKRNVWQKHISNLPINNFKIPFVALENMYNERFIILEAKDFFGIIKKAYKNE